MNIYSPRGTTVVYLDENGYPFERENARKAGFVKGEKYTVQQTNVYSSSTTVYFDEIVGGWNSVMFGTKDE